MKKGLMRVLKKIMGKKRVLDKDYNINYNLALAMLRKQGYRTINREDSFKRIMRKIRQDIATDRITHFH